MKTYRIENKIHAFEQYSLSENNSVIEWNGDKPTCAKLFEAITQFVLYRPTPEIGVKHELPEFPDWQIYTENPVSDMDGFLEGFAEDAEIKIEDAASKWAEFSMLLSDSDRVEIESGGYDSGKKQGIKFFKISHTT